MVRQRYEFSCGLASLATLLTNHHRIEVSEAELLALLRARPPAAFEAASYRDRGVSLADLAWLAGRHGVAAVGLRLPAAALSSLQEPLIVYLEQRGEPHFSVLRGVSADGAVLLADPAAGNRRAGGERFRRWFATDGDRGRALLLAPPAARSPADDRAGPDYYAGYRPRDALLVPPALLR